MRVIFLIIGLFLLFKPNTAEAQELSLGIYPPIIQIEATAPAQIQTPVVIQNMNEEAQELDVVFRVFQPSTKANGEIIFKNSPSTAEREILRKMQVIESSQPASSIRLEGFEQKELTLTLDLLEGDPEGDFYISLLFIQKSESPTKDSSESSIPGGIGSNILLSLGKKGPIRGTIELLKTQPFQTHGPVPISILVSNSSPHMTEAHGRINIKNMFGQRVGKIDLLPSYILARSSRYLTDTTSGSPSGELGELTKENHSQHPQAFWPENFLFGLYTLEAEVQLGENGEVFTRSTSFIALPLPYLVAIIFTLFVIIGIYLRVRKHRIKQ